MMMLGRLIASSSPEQSGVNTRCGILRQVATVASFVPEPMETDERMLDDELQRWAAMEACGSPVLEIPSPTSDAAPVDKQEQETPKPKKKRVRRQREELLYLRKKAKQLEDELSQLTLKECAADEAASLWEGIANRQQDARFQAEKENQRLKRMLHNQITIARRFESFLCGSLDPASGEQSIDAYDDPLIAHAFGHSGRPGSSSADMMAELKQLYLTVDQVIHPAAQVTTIPTIHNPEVLARPDSDGIIVRWHSDVSIPFDWAVTSRGMWRFLAQEQPPMECQQIEHQVVSNHMVVRSFIIPLEEDCGARWKTRQVACKFQEDKRIVIVARSIWASLDAANCSLRSASFEESVRLVISREDTASGSSTIVRSVTHVMPDCADDADAGALSELVLRSVESRMQSMWPVIQNVLIEEDLTAIAEAT